MSGLAAPGGDPAQVRQFAASLETAAGAAKKLGFDTPGVMHSIQTASAWTGPAADASTGLGDDLGDGVTAAGTPLLKAADAFRTYADALQTAQNDVGAYHLAVADATMAGGNDPTYMTDVHRLAATATTSLDAWNTAGTKAASTLQDATADLSRVFPDGAPVRNYLATLPPDIAPSSASGLLGLSGNGLTASTPAPDLGPTALTNPGKPDLVQGVLGDPVLADPALGGALTNPGAGDVGLGALTNPGAQPTGLIFHDSNGQVDEGNDGEGQQGEAEQSNEGEAPQGFVNKFIKNRILADVAAHGNEVDFGKGENPRRTEILETLNNGTVTNNVAGTPYTLVQHEIDGRTVTVVVNETPHGEGTESWAFYSGPQNVTLPGKSR